MKYPIRDIADIVKGQWQFFRTDDAIEHLLLDSRRLIFPATSLFIALQGPRRDGSRFIEELYRRGVRNFMIEHEVSATGNQARAADDPAMAPMPDANIIVVPDTLRALQTLAAWHRRQFSIPVIGITGSNGKTTVKEWLNQLLAPDYRIVRSPKSYNSQIGVPLSVWQLEPSHELAIFEAGISRRGEMARLEPIIRPTIGIFTNIGEAHSEGFDSLAEKAAEKLKLFEGADVLIYCNDQPETVRAVDAWVKERAGARVPQLFAWGHGPGAAVSIDSVTFPIPFTDDASIENAMHCVAACLWLQVPVEQITARIAMLAPIAMRLELKAGINHCSVIKIGRAHV